jgi:hypothetical protein
MKKNRGAPPTAPLFQGTQLIGRDYAAIGSDEPAVEPFALT